jgi:hypothetical protein
MNVKRFCDVIVKPQLRLTLGNIKAGRLSPPMEIAMLEEISNDLKEATVKIAEKMIEVLKERDMCRERYGEDYIKSFDGNF